MTDPADMRFFQALKQVCDRTEAIDQPLRQTLARAVQTGDPQDLQAARQAVDRLDPALHSDLLRQVHLHMATDLSAIWDALPGAPGKPRPN